VSASDAKGHWDAVYAARPPTAATWYQPHAELSLGLIRGTGVARSASIVDVGGGASTLVDDLLDAGYTNVAVLDVSPVALAAARERLGEQRARDVRWIEADITTAAFAPASIDVWHDRAVFHFLTDAGKRAAYVDAVVRSVKPGGHVIVATFADDGPDRCSGLPVVRYRPDTLHHEFGDAFTLIAHEREAHRTPAGAIQRFVYCLCRKGAGERRPEP
jgi:SAM-dependent methyltransferase